MYPLTAAFLGKKVLVKTWDGLQVEGVLHGIEKSHHGGPIGNVVLKIENGFVIVRGDLWSIVAIVSKPGEFTAPQLPQILGLDRGTSRKKRGAAFHIGPILFRSPGEKTTEYIPKMYVVNGEEP